MAKTARKLTIEKSLDKVEEGKDKEILSNIAENLPSASKIRVHKITEDGEKKYIREFPAEVFDSSNPHEFIKQKFFAKYGGGEYQLELVDSEKQIVQKSIIDLIDEDETTPDMGPLKIMNKAMEMKGEAADKLVEASEKIRSAEREQSKSTLDILNNQFQTMMGMYESRLKELKEEKDGSGDEVKQLLLQQELKDMERRMQEAQTKMQDAINQEKQQGGSSDKVFDLINALIPRLVDKADTPPENPIQTITEVMGAVQAMTGGSGDTIDSIMENPMKMKMFQQMLGIGEEKKKDFFEEVLESPEKAMMFKKVMGIEEKKKDFFEEMMESEAKMKMFKTMLGVPDPATMTPPPPIEPKKDFFEQMMEMTSKLSTAKPLLMNMLGVQASPVKNFTELLGTLAMNAGPHIVSAIDKISQSMITVEMLKQGMMPNGEGVATKQNTAGELSGAQQPAQRKTKPRRPVKKISKKASATIKKIEDQFEVIVLDVTSMMVEDETPDSQVFIDKVIENMVIKIEEDSSLIETIINEGNADVLISKMSSVIAKVTGNNKTNSDTLANSIASEIMMKIM